MQKSSSIRIREQRDRYESEMELPPIEEGEDENMSLYEDDDDIDY